MVTLRVEVFCKKKTKRSSWVIAGLGCHKGSCRVAGKLQEKFRGEKGKRSDADQDSGGVWRKGQAMRSTDQRGVEELGSLLHIRLRRSDAHMQSSQRLALKLHFKANDFN